MVIYDGRLTTNPAGMGTIDSVTYDFSDGSSLSLVGATSAPPRRFPIFTASTKHFPASSPVRGRAQGGLEH